MKDNLNLFIVDDRIPQIREFVDQELYLTKLEKDSLLHLLEVSDWIGEYSLKHLTELILNAEHSNNEKIKTFGFTHPSICLDAIEEGLKPDIVIYDWEYGSESHTRSSNWLKEILDATNAFIFVYSVVRNKIPPFLNKAEFDLYSNRFQLFLKGDIDNSIFTAEEFILQYVLSQISGSNEIIIQGKKVLFEENGYLTNSSDILHLEKILGKITLKSKLKSGIEKINNQTIEYILKDIKVNIFLDDKRGLIVTEDSFSIIKKIEPMKKFTAVEILKKYGIKKLKEVLEIGVSKVVKL